MIVSNSGHVPKFNQANSAESSSNYAAKNGGSLPIGKKTSPDLIQVSEEARSKKKLYIKQPQKRYYKFK